jgi:hypothetical protein
VTVAETRAHRGMEERHKREQRIESVGEQVEGLAGT